MSRYLGWLGLILWVGVATAALLAPLIAPYDPQALVAFPFQEPSAAHLLGTDDVGHDLFSQLIYGARLSLLIGLLAALFSVAVGTAVALAAGYYGGGLDALLMRLVDVTLAFPFLPLVIVLAAFLGREFGVTIVAIAAVLWARPAVVLRGQVQKISRFQHVLAAQGMGGSDLYVLRRHIFPRLLPLVGAQFVRAANVAIFLEAALAFLGLGDPNRMSWGTMLYFANVSSAMLTPAWLWWIMPVGGALTVTIVSLAFMSYALEVWADPRLRPTPLTAAGAAASVAHSPQLAAAEPVLRVRNLSVGYGEERLAVANASFAIGGGRVVGLIGESGCGKSTLAAAILRLGEDQRRVTGEVWVGGRDLLTLSARAMRRVRATEIALVPQNGMNALNPVQRVIDGVREVVQLDHGAGAARTRAADLLGLVGIPAERHRAYPHQLSGGMRQRVAIAMAIANEPTLLIADEPTTGLDTVTQRAVLNLLLRLRAELGMALLLISHDLTLIGEVADDLMVMQGGRIVEAGDAAAILAAPHHPHTRQLLAALPPLRVAAPLPAVEVAA